MNSLTAPVPAAPCMLHPGMSDCKSYCNLYSVEQRQPTQSIKWEDKLCPLLFVEVNKPEFDAFRVIVQGFCPTFLSKPAALAWSSKGARVPNVAQKEPYMRLRGAAAVQSAAPRIRGACPGTERIPMYKTLSPNLALETSPAQRTFPSPGCCWLDDL